MGRIEARGHGTSPLKIGLKIGLDFSLYKE
jgi:hypothetical protein